MSRSGLGRGRADLDRRARYKGHYRMLHSGMGRGASPVELGGPADPSIGTVQYTPRGHGTSRNPRRLLERGSLSEPVPDGLKLYDSAEELWSESSGDEEERQTEAKKEAESQELDREIEEAQKKLQALEESHKLKQKRQQLQDLHDRIKQLQETDKGDSRPKQRQERTSAGDLTDWLLDEEARPPASSGRRKYEGLLGDTEWPTTSEDKSDAEERDKRRSRRKIKSGMVARQTDRVVRPQRWAHAEIMEEFGGKHITFQELNFRQFVAGELKIIIEGNISATEKRSRCELLRLMCYLYGIHDWKTVKGVYAYILAKIEKGRLHWGDSIASEVQWALARRGTNIPNSSTGQTKKKGSTAGVDKTWFCQAYQRGLCSKPGSHEATVNGKTVTVQHVCARCLQRDKTKAEHPEKDCTA